MGRRKTVDDDCWEPRYGNDSRPWLLGFSEDVPPVKTTTTKDTFVAEWPPMPNKEGIRRRLLREALWDKVKNELEEEQKREEEVLQTGTTYKQTFVKEGFIPAPIRTNPELHRKYPLYMDQAVTLWREKFASLPGATRAPHNQHQFHRYAGFTKPVDQILDDPIDPL